MKKLILLVACASLLSSSAIAQDVTELFTKGKEAIAKYDKLAGDLMLAKTKDPNAADATANERAALLMEGLNYLNKALPLDTIIEVDKKTGEPKIDKKTGQPKFKVKYSKEIQDMLVGHINDLGNVGDNYFQANDFANAYVAYGAYADALNSPLAKERNYILADTVFGQILFMQAYSAYQIKDFENGYALSKKAMALGFNKYGVGDVKNSCVANIVQNFVNEKKFDAANAYVDKLLAAEPTGFLYDIKGFVVEQEKGIADAAEYFKKSMEAGFGNGVFDYGRSLFTKAQAYIEANPDKSNKELAPTLVPMLKEAKAVLEQAKVAAPESAAGAIVDQLDYQLEQLDAK
ncbi:MAG: hypothetical protein KBT09_01350 [Bacteroidales bacterium]|nr:hypothetical protein [Candidatus Sodaliphilus fimicaballi]